MDLIADWRTLRDPFGIIGWIAATALAHGMPVATGTGSEFTRVAGLSVLEF